MLQLLFENEIIIFSPDHRESRYNQRDARRNLNQNRYNSRPSPPSYSPPADSGRSRRNYRDQEESYNVLLVRNFSSQLNREDIQDSLEHEFRKFGDVNIKVTRDYNGERVAYAVFRDPDDAKDCKNAKGHLVMYDKRLLISVAYDDPPDDRYVSRDVSPYSRDMDYSPIRGRSPVASRGSPRRRSPKRMSGRNRNSPPRERYQQRDRPNYDRYSPPQRRAPARDYRYMSEERSPVRDRYSREIDSPSVDRSPVRRRSLSKDRSPLSSNDTQSNSRRRSSSKDSSPAKKPDASAANMSGPPPMVMPAGPGISDPNAFPGPGFMEKAIPPEDDPFATRTLFVGNLELDVSSYDLRHIFEEYGEIQDIDVKRSSRGQGAYCFIKFANLNQAYKAKVSLNGKMILKSLVRIGYGKVMLSPKIWVGGLGDWTTMADLEREFDRFGSIKKIDFRRGDDSATILYESIDAAQAACSQMRGFLMPNAETRLRIDFLDSESSSTGYDGQDWRHDKNYDNMGSNQSSNDRYSNNKYKNNNARYRGRNVFVDERKSDRRGKHSRSRSPRGKRSKDGKHKSSIHEAAMTEMQLKRFHAKSCYTLHDLCQVFDPPCWQGGFVLKKIAFPVLFFLLDGDMGIFNRTTADPNSPTGRQTMFHVNQRLRMTEDKMKEVTRRMKHCEGKCCLMVCVPGVPENLNMSGTISGPMPTQHKPLRGLVKYFKEKEAAAIISVPHITLNKDKDSAEKEKQKKEVSGFIHAFPPSPFTSEQLLKIGPSLQPQFFADDYLFAVLVKGQSSVLV